MKVYVTKTGVTMMGQAWQVVAMLKQQKKQHKTIQQWIDSVHSSSKKK